MAWARVNLIKATGKYRVTWTDPVTGKDKTISGFARKREAEEAKVRINAELAGGKAPPNRADGRLTFRTVAAEWQEHQTHHSPGTRRSNSDVLVGINNCFGDMSVADIRPQRLAAWIEDMQTRYEPTTAGQHFTIARCVLTFAVKRGYLRESPLSDLRKPSSREQRKIQPMTPAEYSTLVASAPDHFSALIDVGWFAGLRISEAIALTTGQIDWESRELRVDRQIVNQTAGAVAEFGPPKTASGNRVVPMSKLLVESLRNQVERFPPGSDGLMFRSGRGTVYTRKTATAVFLSVRKKAGLRSDLTFHDARHAFCSRLLGTPGISPASVASWAGHSHAGVTLALYAHRRTSDDDIARTQLDLLA